MARARVRRGELKARAVLATGCERLSAGQRSRPEADLRAPVGRYSCEAVTGRVHGTGRLVSSIGIPFVAVIDFRRGILTWSKDNLVGAGDVKLPLAVVRLSRECSAARGAAFGSGYLTGPQAP